MPLNKHKTNCQVYLDFVNFLRDYKDPDEKVVEKDPWAFDEDYDFEDNMVAYDQDMDDNVICCCKKEIPHDESIKFILKADATSLKTILFKSRKAGSVL